MLVTFTARILSVSSEVHSGREQDIHRTARVGSREFRHDHPEVHDPRGVGALQGAPQSLSQRVQAYTQGTCAERGTGDREC